MNLDKTWVALGTTGVVLQKIGAGSIVLCYATATPTTEDCFSLYKEDVLIYPEVAGKTLYAQAAGATARLTFETL